MLPNDFQKQVMRTANSDLSFKDAAANSSMGLAGEAGEYVDLLKKHLYHGHPLDVNKCKKELGDILFYVAWSAELHGLQLEDVMVSVIHKLKIRYPDGFTSADSILRKDIATDV